MLVEVIAVPCKSCYASICLSFIVAVVLEYRVCICFRSLQSKESNTFKINGSPQVMSFLCHFFT